MTYVPHESTPKFLQDHSKPVNLLYSIDLHLITYAAAGVGWGVGGFY